MPEAIIDVKDSTTILQPERGGDLILEDIFPPLDLSDKQEKDLKDWFDNDLKRCARHVHSHVRTWNTYREIYLMDRTDPVYPEVARSNFPSGLLCEKVNMGINRMKRAIFNVIPMFTVNTKSSGISDMNLVHRLEGAMDHIFQNVLKIRKEFGNEALFEFLLDGSLIVEPDILFEIIPRITVKTYQNVEELEKDGDMLLDPNQLEWAYGRLGRDLPVRLVVELKSEERGNLQLFIVDKQDHLIPPGIFRDSDIRFRGRRLYFTETQLRMMASSSVNWYKEKEVEEVIGYRKAGLGYLRDRTEIPDFDRMKPEFVGDIWMGYDWGIQTPVDEMSKRDSPLPYEKVYKIYRITARYSYITKEDPKGLIPKLCVFDYDFDSRTILRARVYPHTHEMLPWVHFKLGHRPKSYYGYGFGALLADEDIRQSNILNLYVDSAANASYPPFLSIHPDVSGYGPPFRAGMGPGQVGYVRAIQDFKMLDISPPAEALISRAYPISQRNAQNRSSLTDLTMGRTESTDPRSPASKAQMLLGQAQIGMESLIDDFSKGMVQLAKFVQHAVREVVLIRGEDTFKEFIVTGVPLEGTAQVTLEELELPLEWISQASALTVNPEQRKVTFLRHFSFFAPLLQQIGQINPELYMKYYVRWMHQAAQELELRGMNYLIPTLEELEGMAPQMMEALESQQENLKASQKAPVPPRPVEPPREPGGEGEGII